MTSIFVLKRRAILIAASVLMAACGSELGEPQQVALGPTGPSPSGPVTLSTPTPVSPTEGEQLQTLRPTLVVENSTSTVPSGSRTYEFQVSDRSDFSLGATLGGSFLVAVNQTGVAEGGGRTSFTLPADLQPTTRMYWRARAVQGSSSSQWSSPVMFKTKLMGYNRPGELYDPLINGETIGTPVRVSFVQGKGVRLDTETSYVRYELEQTISSGEFSAEVEGLQAGEPGEKLKVFSMQNGTGNLLNSPFLMNVQYRGATNANPNNSFSFKVLYGSDARKFEPGSSDRKVASLNGSTTYFWKATWGTGEFRLLVQEGINGPTLYNHAEGTIGSYNPTPHFAYLGANNKEFGTPEGGSRKNAILRHVWISDKPRPSNLGNALD